MIPYGRQSVDDDDIDAVVRVLKGDWLTHGPAVEAFEHALAERVEARHAVAFSSGTAALHGAAAVAGLGPGDRVATSSLSFAASAACAAYVGATPVYVDIDPTTLNLDPGAVPDGIAALVAVHYAGLPVDLAALNHRPPVVIEDAAHALGARTPDGPVGNCARSDMTCFSFHPVKSITTGEGGAVTTNDDDLADRLRAFRHHGLRPRARGGPLGHPDRRARLQLPPHRPAGRAGHQPAPQAEPVRRPPRRAGPPLRRRCWPTSTSCAPPAAPAGTVHARHLYPVLVEHRADVVAELHRRASGCRSTTSRSTTTRPTPRGPPPTTYRSPRRSTPTSCRSRSSTT